MPTWPADSLRDQPPPQLLNLLWHPRDELPRMLAAPGHPFLWLLCAFSGVQTALRAVLKYEGEGDGLATLLGARFALGALGPILLAAMMVLMLMAMGKPRSFPRLAAVYATAVAAYLPYTVACALVLGFYGPGFIATFDSETNANAVLAWIAIGGWCWWRSLLVVLDGVRSVAGLPQWGAVGALIGASLLALALLVLGALLWPALAG